MDDQEPDIDLAAALKGHQDDPPPNKRGRGRPRKVLLKGQEAPRTKGDRKATEPPCPQTPANPSTNINNNTILDDVISNENKFSIKSLLTVKEVNFLEHFIRGELTIEEAMISAGYIDVCERSS